MKPVPIPGREASALAPLLQHQFHIFIIILHVRSILRLRLIVKFSDAFYI